MATTPTSPNMINQDEIKKFIQDLRKTNYRLWLAITNLEVPLLPQPYIQRFSLKGALAIGNDLLPYDRGIVSFPVDPFGEWTITQLNLQDVKITVNTAPDHELCQIDIKRSQIKTPTKFKTIFKNQFAEIHTGVTFVDISVAELGISILGENDLYRIDVLNGANAADAEITIRGNYVIQKFHSIKVGG